jgi:hypothetical protein
LNTKKQTVAFRSIYIYITYINATHGTTNITKLGADTVINNKNPKPKIAAVEAIEAIKLREFPNIIPAKLPNTGAMTQTTQATTPLKPPKDIVCAIITDIKHENPLAYTAASQSDSFP